MPDAASQAECQSLSHLRRRSSTGVFEGKRGSTSGVALRKREMKPWDVTWREIYYSGERERDLFGGKGKRER